MLTCAHTYDTVLSWTQEGTSKLEILMLSTEFCSGLGLRNVLPASEDDVIHVLRHVYSSTSTVLLQLGRGNLRLRFRDEEFVVELMLRVQQTCRRRIQKLKSECVAGLQSVITPQVPWSTRSTSDSFDVQHLMFAEHAAMCAC